ncbi:MAG: phosphoglycolate phosphatase [Magnetococcales bacterium]|nr:phosphoglycolate phosphatase [Magnetococcales bacterium]
MNAPLPCRGVLFDLDGTLVDSAPDLWGAMNHVLTSRGREPLPLDQVRHLVGNGARTLLARGFWGEGAEPPNGDDAFEEAVAAFLDHYRLHLVDHSRPYPGVPEALESLTRQGIPLAVVTNKPERFARSMLEQLGMASRFALVVGGDTLPTRKPDPAPLHHALESLGAPAGLGVMVGDSEVDLEAARNAGIPVILHARGYNRGIDVRQLRPDRVMEHFDQLSELLSFSSSARMESTCHN